ncbi:DUF935 domain-containing protein [Pararhodobacter sp.]|uniref:DUF935 domain-containing protein n=1 Tax=Pararhodobacter sp. TaxID=2127056 RepID=UPI002AFE166B|nr:DUF935 domain-containing protein [Pararhodobacter sp.]
MDREPVLLDRWGRPMVRAQLTTEVAAATVGGVRSPLSGYPADGLNPLRLAHILREADQGDPVRYLELAETIEERDPHYLGVLSTRKRSVSQIDITVEAASDDPKDTAIADMIRDWLKRDELAEELFDILDAIGKGYSFTEILWDTSEGQWSPKQLEWRDPRWFRFAQKDLATPMMLDDQGQPVPLPGGKFIMSVMRAKSGLALRSGLARVAAWGWMFKAFTQRDWAIFAQTYGQPLRLGKWGQGASEEDKSTLFNAVANIAGDCAAIIPESMSIEFVETKSVGASSDLYERRAEWLDRQISKAVLGQTTTTDAISGGHAVSKEHREVQADIERADAIALTAILNRDLIRPWVQLEFGPQKRYPRLVIARPEAEDLQLLSDSLQKLVPLGLQVEESEVRDRFGFADPKPGARILGQTSLPAAGYNPAREKPISLNAEQAKAQNDPEPVAQLLAQSLAAAAQPAVAGMIDTIEAMLDAAGSLEEFRELLNAAWPQIDASGLSERLAEGLIAADLAGRVAVLDETDD